MFGRGGQHNCVKKARSFVMETPYRIQSALKRFEHVEISIDISRDGVFILYVALKESNLRRSR